MSELAAVSLALSPNFWLYEFEVTNTGLSNHVPEDKIPNLRALCHFPLQYLRDRLGRVLITSGYRSPAVNRAVGGAKASRHLLGLAADCVFLDADRPAVWHEMQRLRALDLPFDQVVMYAQKGHFHVQIRLGRLPNRRELLLCRGPGDYIAWQPHMGVPEVERG